MDDLLAGLVRNPVMAALLVGVAALLVYALLKRLLKLALLLLVVVAALLAWFRLTGRDVPEDVDRLARGAGRVAKGAVERTGAMIETGQDVLDATRVAAGDSLTR